MLKADALPGEEDIHFTMLPANRLKRAVLSRSDAGGTLACLSYLDNNFIKQL